MISRRRFFKLMVAAGAGIAIPRELGSLGVQRAFTQVAGRRLGPTLAPLTMRRVLAQIPGGTLPPGGVGKYVLPLVKPPAMPLSKGTNKNKDKYKIAVRQFQQQVLPPGPPGNHPMTTVWSYGSVDHPGTVAEGGTFNYPAFTIEAAWNKAAQVQWRNELVDRNGNFLPHILPVDPTLHWANPPGGLAGRDTRPAFTSTPGLYGGPMRTISHRAMPQRAPSSTTSTASTGTIGRRARQASSTPTTSGRPRCGTTTTRWA
jgi:hypothetical protein